MSLPNAYPSPAWSTPIGFCVWGVPLPKGSKTRIGGHLVEVADMRCRSRAAGALRRWMDAVGWEARRRFQRPSSKSVHVMLMFALPRPKSVERVQPTVKPDLDKLQRPVLDALTGIAYIDDAQVTHIVASKRYADGVEPCVFIEVREVLDA